MSWIWFLLISVLVGSYSSILQKTHIGKSSNNGATSGALINIVTGLVLLLFGIISGSLTIRFEMPMGWYCILAILVFTVAGYAYFSALYTTDISIITIILTFRAVISAVLASYFLHEFVTSTQLWGIVIVGVAIFVVQFAHSKKTGHFRSSGFILSVVATFLFGAGSVLERVFLTSGDVDQIFYLVLVFECTGFAQLLMSFVHRQKVQVHINTASAKRLTLIGILGGASAVLYTNSIIMAPSLSVHAFANQSRVVITVLMAYLILKERDHAHIRILASILCIIGLILLS